MDPVNEHLKTVSETLFNSRLVIEKNASADNISVFNMLLNGTIPRDVYGENIQRFVQFLYRHDRIEYYKYIDKADIRYLTLLTNGNAIAGYLGLKDVVKIERTGDRFTVEAVDPLTRDVERSPSPTRDADDNARPRRRRGGVGRNRDGGRDSNRDNNRDSNRDGGRDSGRDNNRDRGNYRGDNNNRGRNGNNNSNNTNSRSDGAIQRKREPFPPMVLGVNTEIAKRNEDNRRHNDAGRSGSNNQGGTNHQGGANHPGTYKDKLVSRYGNTQTTQTAQSTQRQVIPVIPVEAYQSMITEPAKETSVVVSTGKSARDQLDDMPWGDK